MIILLLLRRKHTIRIPVNLERHKEQYRLKRKENIVFLKRLKKTNPQKLDSIIHPVHEEVFACTDCLKCANCCKTTSPTFTPRDITRISKRLGMSPKEMEDNYLRRDTEEDFVLKSTPCAFLGEDNYCNIYDVRPKACQQFPHTNRRRQHQLLHLTEKNLEVCPAVFEIVDKLKQQLTLHKINKYE